MSRCLALLLLLVSLNAGQAGELRDFDIESYNTWAPRDCAKPEPPYLGHIADAAAFRRAADAFDGYLAEVRTYLTCIAREGEADKRTFDGLVDAGVNRAKNAVQFEMQNARRNLEMRRPH